MSNGDPQHADPADLEQIVAYLDGELAAAECAEVERRLSSDERFLAELQGVDRAWTALDELPRETVEDGFSRTTLDMIVTSVEQDVARQTQLLPTLQRRRRLSTALLAATAATLGFLAVRLATDDPDRDLLADLPVIYQLDTYRQFQEVAFLRDLDERFGDQLEQLTVDGPGVAEQLAELRLISDPAQRAAWLSSMSNQQKQNLKARNNQFQLLPQDQQDRLRNLHGTLAAEEDVEQLRRTMLLYRRWLDGQPPGKQYELRRTTSTQDRLALIGQSMKHEQCKAEFALTDEELRTLENTIRDQAEKMLGGRSRWEYRLPRELRYLAILARENQEELKRAFDNADRRPRDEDSQPAIHPLRQAVLDGLPERTREAFVQLPPWEQKGWFQIWLRRIQSIRREVPEQELERFFAEELDAEEREQLLGMPSDEMYDALRRRYLRLPPAGAAPLDGPRPGFGQPGFGQPGNRPGGFGGGRGFQPNGFGPNGRTRGERGPGQFGPGGRGSYDRGRGRHVDSEGDFRNVDQDRSGE